MEKIKVFMFAVILCSCFFSGARVIASDYEEIEKHPIDVEVEKRIDNDPSTIGMIEAFEYAAKEWDKLLNENYTALMRKLSGEEQEKLRASQREWIKYRDLEFDFNAHFWAGFEGTMYRVFPFDFRADFVRERALMLGNYLESLTFVEP